MSITAFTILILFVYLIALKAIGYVAFKNSTSTTEDYFLASRGVGTFAIIATTSASIFSTGTVVASPGEFYSLGTGYFWIFAFAFCPLCMIPLVLKFWRLGKKKGFITPGDLMGDFYQSRSVKMMIGTIGLIALIPYAAAQMVAIGKTFEALTAGTISYSLGITIVAVAIGLYLYYGGSRAVILTDVIQGVIFTGLLIASGVLCVYWSGGWNTMIGNLNDKASEILTFTPTLKYYEYLPLCASFFLLPYVWQRMYMAKSGKMIAKNITSLPFIFVGLFTITWIIGSSAYTILPEILSDSDNVLGSIFNVKSPYFGAFVLVAAFAAGMSTVDSQLLSAGSLITNDIIPKEKVFNKKSEYKWARIATLVLLIGIYFWSLSLQSQSIFALIVLGISLTPILVPAVYGAFFWKKASSQGAFWSMTLGLIVFLVHSFTPLVEYFPGPFNAVTWSFAVSCISFVLISLVTNHKGLDFKRSEYKRILDLDSETEATGTSSGADSV